jgi:hypothetical protein
MIVHMGKNKRRKEQNKYIEEQNCGGNFEGYVEQILWNGMIEQIIIHCGINLVEFRNKCFVKLIL